MFLGYVEARRNISAVVHGHQMGMGMLNVSSGEQESHPRYVEKVFHYRREALSNVYDSTRGRFGQLFKIVYVRARDQLGMARSDGICIEKTDDQIIIEDYRRWNLLVSNRAK